MPVVTVYRAPDPEAVFRSPDVILPNVDRPNAVLSGLFAAPLPIRSPLINESEATPMPPETVKAPVVDEVDAVVLDMLNGLFAKMRFPEPLIVNTAEPLE